MKRNYFIIGFLSLVMLTISFGCKKAEMAITSNHTADIRQVVNNVTAYFDGSIWIKTNISKGNRPQANLIVNYKDNDKKQVIPGKITIGNYILPPY